MARGRRRLGPLASPSGLSWGGRAGVGKGAAEARRGTLDLMHRRSGMLSRGNAGAGMTWPSSFRSGAGVKLPAPGSPLFSWAAEEGVLLDRPARPPVEAERERGVGDVDDQVDAPGPDRVGLGPAEGLGLVGERPEEQVIADRGPLVVTGVVGDQLADLGGEGEVVDHGRTLLAEGGGGLGRELAAVVSSMAPPRSSIPGVKEKGPATSTLRSPAD